MLFLVPVVSALDFEERDNPPTTKWRLSEASAFEVFLSKLGLMAIATFGSSFEAGDSFLVSVDDTATRACSSAEFTVTVTQPNGLTSTVDNPALVGIPFSTGQSRGKTFQYNTKASDQPGIWTLKTQLLCQSDYIGSPPGGTSITFEVRGTEVCEEKIFDRFCVDDKQVVVYKQFPSGNNCITENQVVEICSGACTGAGVCTEKKQCGQWEAWSNYDSSCGIRVDNCGNTERRDCPTDVPEEKEDLITPAPSGALKTSISMGTFHTASEQQLRDAACTKGLDACSDGGTCVESGETQLFALGGVGYIAIINKLVEGVGGLFDEVQEDKIEDVLMETGKPGYCLKDINEFYYDEGDKEIKEGKDPLFHELLITDRFAPSEQTIRDAFCERNKECKRVDDYIVNCMREEKFEDIYDIPVTEGFWAKLGDWFLQKENNGVCVATPVGLEEPECPTFITSLAFVKITDNDCTNGYAVVFFAIILILIILGGAMGRR